MTLDMIARIAQLRAELNSLESVAGLASNVTRILADDKSIRQWDVEYQYADDDLTKVSGITITIKR